MKKLPDQGRGRSHALGGPAIPGSEDDSDAPDEFVFEQIVHAIGHAEDAAAELQDPYQIAMAWSNIAVAWGALL